MKILMLINSLSAGGAEVFTVSLAVQLKKMGHDLLVYSYAGILDAKGRILQQELQEAGINHLSGVKMSFAAIWQLGKAIQTFKPDIIHTHLEQSDTLLMLARPLKALKLSKSRKPFWIRTIHNEYATKKIPKIAHKLLSYCFDKTIGCSESVENKYPYLGVAHTFIENGITKPTSNTTSQTQTTPIKKASPDTVVFTHIGSFTPRNNILQKSQDTILEALKILQDLDFVVWFVGGGSALEELKAQSELTGVAAKCVFIGVHESPATLLHQSEAFLLPSRFEGMPIACLEAIGCNKPLILSDIPSLQRFQTDCTFYCLPDNPESLAQVMREFISNKSAIAEKAKTTMPIEFLKYSIEESAKKYQFQYESLLNQST